jgi:hypothetical protein
MPVDLSRIENVELGVGIGTGENLALFSLPIEDNIGDELVGMYRTTLSNWDEVDGEPREFNPSEKPAAKDKLIWPNTEEDCPTSYRCFQTGTIDHIGDLAARASELRFYFARISDRDESRVVAVASANVFKRAARANKIVRFWNSSLRILRDPVFQLDYDFDFWIEVNEVKILRPRKFVFICEMQDVIREAAPRNVEAINEHLPMFDLRPIAAAAKEKSRVANLVASIRNQNLMVDLNLEKFTNRCTRIGIEFEQENGRMVVAEKDIVKFLEVIDCRRYSTDLTNNDPAEWLASGRDRAKR